MNSKEKKISTDIMQSFIKGNVLKVGHKIKVLEVFNLKKKI